MVEIFRTNIEHSNEANALVCILGRHFPEYRINVDLNDCDKILRVQAKNGSVDIENIVKIVKAHSYEIEFIME